MFRTYGSKIKMEDVINEFEELEGGETIPENVELDEEEVVITADDAETSAEVEELEDVGEAYSEDVAALENVIGLVRSFEAEGGMNHQTAQVLGLIVEPLAERLCIKLPQPSYAVEAYASASDRLSVTSWCLEGWDVGAKITEIWANICKFFKMLVTKTKEFYHERVGSLARLKGAFESLSKSKRDGSPKEGEIKIGNSQFATLAVSGKGAAGTFETTKKTLEELSGLISEISNNSDPASKVAKDFAETVILTAENIMKGPDAGIPLALEQKNFIMKAAAAGFKAGGSDHNDSEMSRWTGHTQVTTAGNFAMSLTVHSREFFDPKVRYATAISTTFGRLPSGVTTGEAGGMPSLTIAQVNALGSQGVKLCDALIAFAKKKSAGDFAGDKIQKDLDKLVKGAKSVEGAHAEGGGLLSSLVGMSATLLKSPVETGRNVCSVSSAVLNATLSWARASFNNVKKV
jgi:hypothetical protein